jgi:hypothetical protein
VAPFYAAYVAVEFKPGEPVDVPLEKGSHAVLVVQRVGGRYVEGGRIPARLCLRQTDGSVQPVPTDWFRH